MGDIFRLYLPALLRILVVKLRGISVTQIICMLCQRAHVQFKLPIFSHELSLVSHDVFADWPLSPLSFMSTWFLKSCLYIFSMSGLPLTSWCTNLFVFFYLEKKILFSLEAWWSVAIFLFSEWQNVSSLKVTTICFVCIILCTQE